MYSGPFIPGFHILIGLAFAVFWLVVAAALFALLYFVIRHAVTDGTLRADAIREGRPYVRHRRAHAPAAPPAPAPAAPVRPPAPEPERPADSEGDPRDEDRPTG